MSLSVTQSPLNVSDGNFTSFSLTFDDITPPPMAHVPSVLSAEGFGSLMVTSSDRIETLRRRNMKKYRKPPTVTPRTLGSQSRASEFDMDLQLERMLLFVVGSLGIALNVAFLFALLMRRAFRNMSYAFMLHGVLVDIAKAAYAILYALNIHASKDILLVSENDEAVVYDGSAQVDAPTAGSFLTAATKWLFGTHGERGEQIDEHICTVIGTTYIMVVTVSIINLIAILCTETYIFTDDNLFLLRQNAPVAAENSSQPVEIAITAPHNTPRATQRRAGAAGSSETVSSSRSAAHFARQRPRRRRKSAKESADESSDLELDAEADANEYVQPHRAYSLNCCCVLFAVCIIYVCTLILHLGPTIIAGQFDMNNAQDEFYCNMVTGEIRNYISYLMWLIIVSLAMFGACYYASVFYRYVASYSEHRVMGLVRASVIIASGGNDGPEAHNSNGLLIQLYMNRARVLIIILIGYAICYYPQFLLILSSRRLAHPTVLYKAFRIISLSNPIFTPLIFLIVDQQVRPSSLCLLLRDWRKGNSAPIRPARRRQRADLNAGARFKSTSASAARFAFSAATASDGRQTVKADASLRDVFVNVDAGKAVCTLVDRAQLGTSPASAAFDSDMRVMREASQSSRNEPASWPNRRLGNCYDDSLIVIDHERERERPRYEVSEQMPLFIAAEVERSVVNNSRRNQQRLSMRTMMERGASTAAATGDTFASTVFANPEHQSEKIPDNSVCRPSTITNNRTVGSGTAIARPPGATGVGESNQPPKYDMLQTVPPRYDLLQSNSLIDSAHYDASFPANLLSGAAQRTSALLSQNALNQLMSVSPQTDSSMLWFEAERGAASTQVCRRELDKRVSSSVSTSFGGVECNSNQMPLQMMYMSSSSLSQQQQQRQQLEQQQQQSNVRRSLSVASDKQSRQVNGAIERTTRDRDSMALADRSNQMMENETNSAYLYGNTYETSSLFSTPIMAVRRVDPVLPSGTQDPDSLLMPSGAQFRMNL